MGWANRNDLCHVMRMPEVTIYAYSHASQFKSYISTGQLK